MAVITYCLTNTAMAEGQGEVFRMLETYRLSPIGYSTTF